MKHKYKKHLDRIATALAVVLAMQFSLVNVSYAQDNDSIVVLFGDSLSYGYNSQFQDTQPGAGRLNRGQPSIMLSAILNSNDRPSKVANHGIGGSASGPSMDPNLFSNNGLNRINANLASIKTTYPGSAYYALIIYGTNDHAYSIPPSATGFNTGEMIKRADNLGYTTLVGTLPPCVCKNVVIVNNQIKAAVSSRVASSVNGVYLVDHYANLAPQWSSLVDPDGVHPSNAGYMKMAQYWFDQRLESLIAANPKVNLAPIISILLDD